MIYEGVSAIDWEKYSVQPANNIVVPCSEIEAQDNYTGTIDWAFGATVGSGSLYEGVSDYYAENTPPSTDTGYIGGPVNGNCTELGDNRNFAIEYEPGQTYYMIVRYTYDCPGEGTCAQEEWHTINTTGAIDYALVLILIAFVCYGFFKLVNSIVYHDTNS